MRALIWHMSVNLIQTKSALQTSRMRDVDGVGQNHDAFIIALSVKKVSET